MSDGSMSADDKARLKAWMNGARASDARKADPKQPTGARLKRDWLADRYNPTEQAVLLEQILHDSPLPWDFEIPDEVYEALATLYAWQEAHPGQTPPPPSVAIRAMIRDGEGDVIAVIGAPNIFHLISLLQASLMMFHQNLEATMASRPVDESTNTGPLSTDEITRRINEMKDALRAAGLLTPEGPHDDA